MDGEVLTAIRTGAGSGVATDALARPDAAVAGHHRCRSPGEAATRGGVLRSFDS